MKRGFTLLEVLIAGGILFIVSTAVVGLSNSIVQGTSSTNDKTQISLWAQSGLDLMAKIRDDNVASSTGDTPWLAQAVNDNANPYGWYYLNPNANCQSWSLTKYPAGQTLAIADIINNKIAEPMERCNTGTSLAAYRLICIEAYSASDVAKGDSINCNTNSNGDQLNDGDRTNVTDCQTSITVGQPNDDYCQLTKPSLNRGKQTNELQTFIPSGNALKIRSVIVWQDRGSYRAFDLGTLLTNWKTIGNI